MRQFIPFTKLKAQSLKPKACQRLFNIFGLKLPAFSFQLPALSFLLTSFGTEMRLLWRAPKADQVRFSMASSLLGSFQNVGWQMADVGWQKKNIWKTKLAAFSFKLLACSFFISVFLFQLCFSANAQNTSTIDTTIAMTDSANVYYDDSTSIANGPTDTSKIDNKKIMAAIVFLSQDSIKFLRKSKGFGYMAFLDSLLKAREAAKKKQPRKQEAQPSTSFWDVGVVKLLCWMVAIGVVSFVLYKLFLGQGNAFSSNAKNNIPQVEMDEEPDLDDLDRQLKKAIQSGNYRLATRYLFLTTLQKLADKNAISLSSEKTNFQYSHELQGKPYADGFSRLCLLYEYVWFGEFEVNEAQFASIQQQQQQLLKAI